MSTITNWARKENHNILKTQHLLWKIKKKKKVEAENNRCGALVGKTNITKIKVTIGLTLNETKENRMFATTGQST